MMKNRRFLSVMLLALFLLAAAVNIQAQDSNTSQTTKQAETKEETNLETQLYLIVGTDADVPDSKLPGALDTVVRQLRATLPFKNYRLAATMINRVKNEG